MDGDYVIDKKLRPYRNGSLVPWGRHVHAVVRSEKREAGMVYWLRPVGQVQWRLAPAIAHGEILRSMEEFARYKVGGEVYIDHRLIQFRILDRKWSFSRGTVIYTIVDRKRVIMRVYRTQEQLMAAEQAHVIPDTPREPLPEGYSDSPRDW